MTTRDETPVGAPIWFDLATSDVQKSSDFYRQLFGWDVVESGEEHGGYRTFTYKGESVCGLMGKMDESWPDAWSIYFASDDIDDSYAKALAAGATPIAEPMEIPDVGKMAFVMDPAGAATGLYEPGQHKGFGILLESSSPRWFECHTKNFAESVKFYPGVLGVDLKAISDSDEFRYSVLGRGEDEWAGIMDASAMAPEEMPSCWRVYIEVDDPDAVSAKCVELGGQVMMAPEDTPYGRLGVLLDPTGASISIVRSPDDAPR